MLNLSEIVFLGTRNYSQQSNNPSVKVLIHSISVKQHSLVL